jgi:trimeric autotransporter adhesin
VDPWRRWGITAGCTVLVLGVGASGSSAVLADELPQRALQAVTVELGTDGSVTALSSSLISRDDDGTSTRAQALNPADTAGDLPVRVTTSWRHDGEVGTDLADLVGVSGRVEINVTVQNATVHAERFQYDAGGVAQESYELVATPMTVVASATLPDGSGAGLVRPQPGATEPGTTNGVIDTDGTAATVQWASLLAPPRLSASTTFSLVQDTEDFELPAISVAVQPGLATDTSVARLVSTSFDGTASVIGSENNTIGLIANVNATLAEVADSLQTVQQTLSVNAGEVGTAATAALSSTAASVDAAAQAVLADLTALDRSIGSTVQSTNGQALTALQVSVQGVRDYFGTAAELDDEPAADAGCGVAPADADEPATTLLGQLSTVSRQLEALSSASGDCVDTLRSTLRASIGDGEECTDPAHADLVCRLMAGGSTLSGVADDLSDQGLAALGLLDDTAVDEVGVAVGDVVDAVVGLQQTGADVGDLVAGDADQQLLDLLDDLAGGLLDARDAVDTSGVRAQLDALVELAEDRLTEMAGDRETSVQAQLAAVADALCDLRPRDPDEAAAYDELHAQIDGTDCDQQDVDLTGTDFPTPLTDRVDAQLADWEAVRDSLDGTDPDGAAAALAELEYDFDDLSEQIAAVRGSVVTGGSASSAVRRAVAGLIDDLCGLYAAPAGTTSCDPLPAGTAPPLNVLAASVADVDSGQQTLVATIKGLLEDAAADFKAAGTAQLQDAADEAAAAGAAADSSLDGLTETLLEQLGAAADQQVAQGQAVVAAQQARLAAVQAAAERDLGASAEEAVARLAEQVAAADQQQSAAAAALQAQLRKVLVDLGSAQDGRGLLGVMQNSAGQTGVRTEQVEQTTETAASYQAVRVTELADAQLERQQLVRSLQAAQQMEPFGVDLPDGSTSATVFSFRLGGES